MALGKRTAQQNELFIPTAQIVTGPGHPFYNKLNEVLAEAAFDNFVAATDPALGQASLPLPWNRWLWSI